jgi:hypothetical protein
MLMKKTAIITSLALLLLLAGCAREAQQSEAAASHPPPTNSLKPVRVSAENTDAAEPTVAPAPDGTIFIAWVEHRENKESDVMLAHLDREGRAMRETVRVNGEAGEATAWRGDPPTVAVSSDGTIYVGWTARVAAQAYANDLYLSVSRNGGNSFEPPVKVNDDEKKVAHAMPTIASTSPGSTSATSLCLPPTTRERRWSTWKPTVKSSSQLLLTAGARSPGTHALVKKPALAARLL